MRVLLDECISRKLKYALSANLEGHAEFVRAKAVCWSSDQRHVDGYAGEP
jgi:hypothetical protein